MRRVTGTAVFLDEPSIVIAPSPPHSVTARDPAAVIPLARCEGAAANEQAGGSDEALLPPICEPNATDDRSRLTPAPTPLLAPPRAIGPSRKATAPKSPGEVTLRLRRILRLSGRAEHRGCTRAVLGILELQTHLPLVVVK